MLWSILSSLLVSAAVAWLTSVLAFRRWRKERIASSRDVAYENLCMASYRFVRTMRDSNIKELDGEPADIESLERTYSELNDCMFMLSKVALEESFMRISRAYDRMVDAAQAVDLTDPALQTTGTELGRMAQEAMNDFVEVVSEEMRKNLAF